LLGVVREGQPPQAGSGEAREGVEEAQPMKLGPLAIQFGRENVEAASRRLAAAKSPPGGELGVDSDHWLNRWAGGGARPERRPHRLPEVRGLRRDGVVGCDLQGAAVDDEAADAGRRLGR